MTTDPRPEASGDEAGTAPGDRRFRPDIQGLRAVAILLVVLYHAHIPGVGGGFVGVDVFFVISGFVITGVLLRERASTGGTSILAFYARRVRRIIPAASLVIVVTVLAAYVVLGPVSGRQTAVDGQWASVFLVNFHFIATETNYLASQTPPSPLQNFWSLAVEEQFYVVYPTIFLLVASTFVRTSFRIRMSVLLVATIVGSFVLSVTLTSSDPINAFFSPFTRAWELALGALIAVSAGNLRRLPATAAAALSWLGLAAIVIAAVVFTSATSYPGSLVAVPVIGAGLVIAGGTVGPSAGAEAVLGLRPFQWLGLVSYSFYLWHWPVLILATEWRGVPTLATLDNVLLVLVALALSIGTYLVVENPARHSATLIARRGTTIALGGCLVATTLLLSTFAAVSTAEGAISSLAIAKTGSNCHRPSDRMVARLRSLYRSGNPHPTVPAQPHTLRMVVVGDSTACTLIPGLTAVGSSLGVQVENGAVIGCGVVSGEIAPVYDDNVNVEAKTDRCLSKARRAESSAIKALRPDVILWGSIEERQSIVDAGPTGISSLITGTPQWKAVMQQRIDARVTDFLATGAKVVLLLEPVPVSRNPNGPVPSQAAYSSMNAMLRQEAVRHPDKVGLVDLSSRVCPTSPHCRPTEDGVIVRPDLVHYSPDSSLWVAQWLVPQVLSTVDRLR
jgi:peptidoglycan/LPS O-acetylase OafA/YrhL